MLEQKRFSTGSFALAFVAGAAAGAAVAYLTSPGTGRENREALLRGARDLKNRAVEGVSGVQQRFARAGRAAREAFVEGNGTSIHTS